MLVAKACVPFVDQRHHRWSTVREACRDVHVLNHDGNLTDACALAAVVSLLHFRKKDVEVRAPGIEKQCLIREREASIRQKCEKIPQVFPCTICKIHWHPAIISNFLQVREHAVNISAERKRFW